MAGSGAGPSRKSHTKSRKGCRTCKRRHIRCDEIFPQCRNCTKHQVRCDYMEAAGSENESQQHSPEPAAVRLTPNSEAHMQRWQQTGSFPYPDLHVFPPPQTHEHSENELRLIQHIASVSNTLLTNVASNLTLWTQKMPKFLSIASSYPFVMQALLSFSASHLAWLHSSVEMRNLHLHHGSVALRGLHEAIGSFSRANADAVLAASLLLLWQANDWRSWSSLRAGIQSVLAAMQAWSHESVFAEYIAEEDLLATAFRTHSRISSINPGEQAAVLQNTLYSLQRLQMSLTGQEVESRWVGQLIAHVERLQTLSPAQSPEEQFNNCYQLRKWLFWVPVDLFKSQGGHGPALLTLAYLYATALSLEPLFPDLGSSFCSAMALAPLEAIVAVTNAMQSEQGPGASASEIASLMQYPQQTAFHYRARAMQTQQSRQQASMSFNLRRESFAGNLSPAFAPSTPQYTPGLNPRSQYLGVAAPQNASFTTGTQTWGVMPSPGLPAQVYSTDELEYNNMSLGGIRGGTPTEYEYPEAGPSQRHQR